MLRRCFGEYPHLLHTEESDTNSFFFHDEIAVRLAVIATGQRLLSCSTWNPDPAVSTKLRRLST